MNLKVVIFIFWTLTGEWTKSVVQDLTVCFLRICPTSFTSRTFEARERLPISSISCGDNNGTTCRRVFNFLQTCPTTAPMQNCPNPLEDPTSWCQCCPYTAPECSTTTQTEDDRDSTEDSCPLCPSTIADYSTTTLDPPTPSTDCPTTPTDIPMSSKPIESDISSQISDERDSLMVAVISLGVLVGILVVLLVVVTSGWVWTCWRMKRNKATSTSDHVRTTQNTAYGVIGPVGSSTGGQTSGHQERKTENDYQIMNEERAGDNGEEHEYHILEGLGDDRQIHHNRELEMRVVEGSGEEHAYHILERPGSDDASREPGWRDVGGAMDYEVPLPLKK